MRVRLEKLTKKFGDVVAVDAIDLRVSSGEFVALLGPSGCGKTTTLLMVAGIYRPTEGAIVFGDRRVEQLMPKERGIGMVFQSYALYPHMTVAENIGFPLDVGRGVNMADRVALMNDGKLQAYATPTELYAHPANRFVAEFIGTPPMNFFPAELAARNGTTVARAEGIEIELPAAPRGEATRQATVGVRPEHVAIVAPGQGNANGELFVLEPMGREQIVDVRVGERRIQVIAPPGFTGQIGDSVGLRVPPERLHL